MALKENQKAIRFHRQIVFFLFIFHFSRITRHTGVGDSSIKTLPLCRSKRAAYKYAKDRGAVASRWCWLATQISELDYKIRQHTDLRKHIKDNKGAVTLEEVIGSQESDETAARIRPFAKLSFRKRKLVQTANLHQVSKKAGRPR